MVLLDAPAPFVLEDRTEPENDTSARAYQKTRQRRAELQKAILEALLVRQGQDDGRGMTDWELSLELEESMYGLTSCRAHLMRKGLVRDSNLRRKTPMDGRATVWVIGRPGWKLTQGLKEIYPKAEQAWIDAQKLMGYHAMRGDDPGLTMYYKGRYDAARELWQAMYDLGRPGDGKLTDFLDIGRARELYVTGKKQEDGPRDITSPDPS